MEIKAHVSKMKELYSAFINFIEATDGYQDEYGSFIQVLENQEILKNPVLTLDLHRLISSVEENHQRTSDFYEKIEQIIQYVFKNSKTSFSNSEIFQIYKTGKRILLLLLEKKYLIPNESIISQILEEDWGKYCYYLYSAIKQCLSKDQQTKIESDIKNKFNEDIESFANKCRIGENDSYICYLIRQDMIEDFVTYYHQSNINLSCQITPSIFESHSFLIDKTPTLIEYATFFGSINIIKFLKFNEVYIDNELWHYAIHSNDPELIHFCEENHILKNDANYVNILRESIHCHHNNIYDYVRSYLISQKRDQIYNDVFDSYIKSTYNYMFYPEDIESMISKTKKYYYGFNICDLCSSLTTVTIPESVTVIGRGAFYNCSSLIELKIPPSVKRIENHAFSECSSLVKIDIPNSVTHMEDDIFKDCSSLKEITIPSGIKSIGDSFCDGCSSLEKVTISSSVKSIGNSAFLNCSSLKSVEIPSSVRKIDYFAFSGCSSLTTIEIPSSIKSIEQGTFKGCK